MRSGSRHAGSPASAHVTQSAARVLSGDRRDATTLQVVVAAVERLLHTRELLEVPRQRPPAGSPGSRPVLADRYELDGFLKLHGVPLEYTVDDFDDEAAASARLWQNRRDELESERNRSRHVE